MCSSVINLEESFRPWRCGAQRNSVPGQFGTLEDGDIHYF